MKALELTQIAFEKLTTSSQRKNKVSFWTLIKWELTPIACNNLTSECEEEKKKRRKMSQLNYAVFTCVLSGPVCTIKKNL